MALKNTVNLAPGAKQGLTALLDTWAKKYVVAPRSAAQGTGDGVGPTKTNPNGPNWEYATAGDMKALINNPKTDKDLYGSKATMPAVVAANNGNTANATVKGVPSKEQFAKMYPTADPSEYNQFVQNFQQDLARRNQTIKLADGTTQNRIPVGADGMNMQRIVENDAAGNPQIVYRDASMTTRPAVDANGNFSRNYAPPTQGMASYRITQDQLNQLIYAARSGALDEFYPEMIDQINSTKK